MCSFSLSWEVLYLKNKISKKILSLFLAVLMCITTIPSVCMEVLAATVASGQAKISNGSIYEMSSHHVEVKTNSGNTNIYEYNIGSAEGKGYGETCSLVMKYVSTKTEKSGKRYPRKDDIPVYRVSRAYGYTTNVGKAGAVTAIDIGDDNKGRNKLILAAKKDGISLSKTKASMIQLVLLNGFKQFTAEKGTNQFYKEELFFVATQCLIWEIEEGKRTGWGNDPSNYVNTTDKKYNSIADKYENRTKTMSSSYNTNLDRNYRYYWHDFYYTVKSQFKSVSGIEDYYAQILKACNNSSNDKQFTYKIGNGATKDFANYKSADYSAMKYNKKNKRYELTYTIPNIDFIGTGYGQYNTDWIVLPLRKNVNGTATKVYATPQKTVTAYAQPSTSSTKVASFKANEKIKGDTSDTDKVTGFWVIGMTKNKKYYRVSWYNNRKLYSGYVSADSLNSGNSDVIPSSPYINFTISGNQITFYTSNISNFTGTVFWTRRSPDIYNNSTYFNGTENSELRIQGFVCGGKTENQTVGFKLTTDAYKLTFKCYNDNKELKSKWVYPGYKVVASDVPNCSSTNNHTSNNSATYTFREWKDSDGKSYKAANETSVKTTIENAKKSINKNTTFTKYYNKKSEEYTVEYVCALCGETVTTLSGGYNDSYTVPDYSEHIHSGAYENTATSFNRYEDGKTGTVKYSQFSDYDEYKSRTVLMYYDTFNNVQTHAAISGLDELVEKANTANTVESSDTAENLEEDTEGAEEASEAEKKEAQNALNEWAEVSKKWSVEVNGVTYPNSEKGSFEEANSTNEYISTAISDNIKVYDSTSNLSPGNKTVNITVKIPNNTGYRIKYITLTDANKEQVTTGDDEDGTTVEISKEKIIYPSSASELYSCSFTTDINTFTSSVINVIFEKEPNEYNVTINYVEVNKNNINNPSYSDETSQVIDTTTLTFDSRENLNFIDGTYEKEQDTINEDGETITSTKVENYYPGYIYDTTEYNSLEEAERAHDVLYRVPGTTTGKFLYEYIDNFGEHKNVETPGDLSNYQLSGNLTIYFYYYNNVVEGGITYTLLNSINNDDTGLDFDAVSNKISLYYSKNKLSLEDMTSEEIEDALDSSELEVYDNEVQGKLQNAEIKNISTSDMYSSDTYFTYKELTYEPENDKKGYYYFVIEDNIFDQYYYAPVVASGYWDGYQLNLNSVCTIGPILQTLTVQADLNDDSVEDDNIYPAEYINFFVIDKTALQEGNYPTRLDVKNSAITWLASILVNGKVDYDFILKNMVKIEWVCPNCPGIDPEDAKNTSYNIVKSSFTCPHCGANMGYNNGQGFINTDSTGSVSFYTNNEQYFFSPYSEDGDVFEVNGKTVNLNNFDNYCNISTENVSEDWMKERIVRSTDDFYKFFLNICYGYNNSIEYGDSYIGTDGAYGKDEPLVELEGHNTNTVVTLKKAKQKTVDFSIVSDKSIYDSDIENCTFKYYLQKENENGEWEDCSSGEISEYVELNTTSTSSTSVVGAVAGDNVIDDSTYYKRRTMLFPEQLTKEGKYRVIIDLATETDNNLALMHAKYVFDYNDVSYKGLHLNFAIQKYMKNNQKLSLTFGNNITNESDIKNNNKVLYNTDYESAYSTAGAIVDYENLTNLFLQSANPSFVVTSLENEKITTDYVNFDYSSLINNLSEAIISGESASSKYIKVSQNDSNNEYKITLYAGMSDMSSKIWYAYDYGKNYNQLVGNNKRSWISKQKSKGLFENGFVLVFECLNNSKKIINQEIKVKTRSEHLLTDGKEKLSNYISLGRVSNVDGEYMYVTPNFASSEALTIETGVETNPVNMYAIEKEPDFVVKTYMTNGSFSTTFTSEDNILYENQNSKQSTTQSYLNYRSDCVYCDSSYTINTSPNVGCFIYRITDNGKDVTEEELENVIKNNVYKLDNINSDHIIRIYAKKQTYSIKTNITNGTITASEKDIPKDESRTIEFTPNNGYSVSSIMIDGENLSPYSYANGGSYTFNNINSNHSVIVTCEKATVINVYCSKEVADDINNQFDANDNPLSPASGEYQLGAFLGQEESFNNDMPKGINNYSYDELVNYFENNGLAFDVTALSDIYSLTPQKQIEMLSELGITTPLSTGVQKNSKTSGYYNKNDFPYVYTYYFPKTLFDILAEDAENPSLSEGNFYFCVCGKDKYIYCVETPNHSKSNDKVHISSGGGNKVSLSSDGGTYNIGCYNNPDKLDVKVKFIQPCNGENGESYYSYNTRVISTFMIENYTSVNFTDQNPLKISGCYYVKLKDKEGNTLYKKLETKTVWVTQNIGISKNYNYSNDNVVVPAASEDGSPGQNICYFNVLTPSRDCKGGLENIYSDYEIVGIVPYAEIKYLDNDSGKFVSSNTGFQGFVELKDLDDIKSNINKNEYNLNGGTNYTYSESENDKNYNNTACWEEYTCENSVFTKHTYNAKLSFDKLLLKPTATSSYNKSYNPSKLIKQKDSEEYYWETKSGYSLQTQITAKTTIIEENNNSVVINNAVGNTGISAQSATAYFPENYFSNNDNEYSNLMPCFVNNTGSLVDPDGFGYKNVVNFSGEKIFTFSPLASSSNFNVHYIPVWYPNDTEYSVQVKISDAWTPAGMLSYIGDTNNVKINGSVFDDYKTRETSIY